MNSPDRFVHKQERAKRCRNKIALIESLLEPIWIEDPSNFKALLMPCLHGEELVILLRKGVPRNNIVAIEGDPSIWRKIKDRHRIDVGLEPLKAHISVDRIDAHHPDGFDLAYVDMYSQLGFPDRLMLQKMFAFRMFRPGSKLLLNYGKNRTSKETAEINEMISRGSGLGPVPTEVDVRAAIEITGHPQPRYITPHPYKSSLQRETTRTYMTLEVQF